MSLTLPANYESASKSGNFKENWVAQLFNADSYLSFDGDNDYINLGATTSTSPASLTSTTKLSISMWVNFPVEDVSEWIFVNNSVDNGYSGFSIYRDSGNKFSLIIGDGAGTASGDYRRFRTSTTYSVNTWYHVVITTGFANDGSDTIFYVNGSTSGIATDEAGSSAVTTPSYASGNAYFGRGDAAHPDAYAQFSIKNFAVYSSLLDQTNITAMYNSGNFKSLLYDFTGYDESSNLKGYWEFNNGEPTIQDLSGNGTNGTIHGATYKDFLPLALSDTAIDSVFYHGCVTRIGSIRDSIDLAKSQAKTSNLSLSLANFKYKGDSLSAELFLGSRDYYNYNVRIYSQLNSASALSDCLQVYQGRLINVAHSQSNVTLQLTEQRPYDMISIPNTRTSSSDNNNIYFPIAYGDFEGNSEGSTTRKTLRPIPFVQTMHDGKVFGSSIESSTGDAHAHLYNRNKDAFLRANQTSANNISKLGGYVTEVRDNGKRYMNIYPFEARDESPTSTHGWNNETSAFDLTSGFAYFSDTTSTGAGTRTSNLYLNVPELDFGTIIDDVSSMVIWVTYEITNVSGTGTVVIKGGYENDSTVTTATHTGSGNIAETQDSIRIFKNTSSYPNYINLQHTSATSDSGGFSYKLQISDIYLRVLFDDSDETFKEISMAYTGEDGLKETYSGSSGDIEHGHEALRDMLVRFTGFDTADPDGWSALHTDRHISTWTIRWWAIEPIELKSVLNRMMFEFGFIFKFRADGTGRVIHILQTSELSASQTLNISDITNVSISTSSFDSMVTKMNINYEKHPAANKYISNVTSTNDTSRIKYKIKSKENIKDENLDMNVGTPNTTGQTDPNTDFYSYYDNILGDIKKIVRCDIVNPAKSYAMETGDIIQFSSTAGEMPVDPFGHGWDQDGYDFYMITKLVRSVGSVKIECREVG